MDKIYIKIINKTEDYIEENKHRKITLEDVVNKYGYTSSSSYNKAFKKYYGVSPTEYRKARMEKL